MRSWIVCSLVHLVLSVKQCWCQTADDGGALSPPSSPAFSRLNVHIPHKLYKANGYDHTIALFGTPKYAGSTAQYVYYADDNLCAFDYTKAAQGGYPERPRDKHGNMPPWQPPFILLIDRSDDCHFVQQVRNAERAGATGVVIANDRKEPLPLLADDGSGGGISIPSTLMGKEDSGKVKAELLVNRTVQIRMTWAYPHTSMNDSVQYDLWTAPLHAISRYFMRDFRQVVQALGGRIRFTPHMYIADGFREGCQEDGESTPRCDHSCTSGGHYCAPVPLLDEPFFWLRPWPTGAEVVRESLRRLCIWKHYGDELGQPMIWWDYVYWFLENCESPKYFANEECINYVYQLADVDKAIIDSCMDASQTNETTNTLLDFELKSQSQFGVIRVPTMIVDGEIEEQFDDMPLSVGNVFKTLCHRFSRSAAPEICIKCAQRRYFSLECILESDGTVRELPSAPKFAPQVDRGFELGKGRFMIGVALVIVVVVSLLERSGRMFGRVQRKKHGKGVWKRRGEACQRPEKKPPMYQYDSI